MDNYLNTAKQHLLRSSQSLLLFYSLNRHSTLISGTLFGSVMPK